MSKWETNVSFPDVSVLPIIANFFGVSTDELLGVDIDKRESKINEICELGDKLCAEEKYAEEVALMRDALTRFPGNDKLMYRLAWSLTGTIRENPANLDEAISFTLKILEISTDTEIRAKATRDLMYRYLTKGETAIATHYAEQLPRFDVCYEYNVGRGNIFEGEELAKYLQKNIKLYGKAMMECFEYFQNTVIIKEEDMNGYTVESVKEKMEMLRKIIEE